MEKYGEFPFMTLKNIYFTSMTAHVNYDMEAYALQLEQEAQVQNTTPSRQHRFRIFQRHSVEGSVLLMLHFNCTLNLLSPWATVSLRLS
jgi:hypothetical protein